MINVDKLIKDVEQYNAEVALGRVAIGVRIKYLDDAVKVMKMWKYLKEDSALYDAQEIPEIEEKFFPSLITQTVTVKIQGKNTQRINAAIATIECIEGVKEVELGAAEI